MGKLIKKIKIKKQDGTFTDYIPIGAEASNINMANDYSVQKNIGNIDIDKDGDISEQLEKIMNKTALNINDYGAVANDTTIDSWEAIQSAIDDGIRLEKPVYVPMGTYYISKPLKVYGKDSDTYTIPTIIQGETRQASVIKKITNNKLDNDLDYDEDAIILLCNASAIDDSAYDNTLSASGFVIENLYLTGNSTITPKYGIYSKQGISTANFLLKNIHINYCNEACLCMKSSAYLARIENVRVDRAHYGMYIHDGVNTSLNIVNCYAMGDKIGYYIGGIYMTMNCCCGDWCTERVFDLEEYHGSLISPGSESTGADYCFYFRNSDVTVTGAHTFGNFTEEDAAHIYVGWCKVVFIGGVLMVSNSSTKKTAPGYFIKRATWGDITFINTRLDGFYTKGKGETGEPDEVQTYLDHGMMTYRAGQGLPYLGYDKRGERDSGIGIVKQNPYLEGNAIFFGMSSRMDLMESGRSFLWSRGTSKGDIALSKDNSNCGILGAVQATENSQYFPSGKWLPIPVVMSGTSQERPKDPWVGVCYFDTTLNKPIWCKKRGNLPAKQFLWNSSTYQAPTEELTLIMNIEGNEKSIVIPKDTTLEELTSTIIRTWFDSASDYNFYVYRRNAAQLIVRAKNNSIALNNISFTIDGEDAASILGYEYSTYGNGANAEWVDANGNDPYNGSV